MQLNAGRSTYHPSRTWVVTRGTPAPAPGTVVVVVVTTRRAVRLANCRRSPVSTASMTTSSRPPEADEWMDVTVPTAAIDAVGGSWMGTYPYVLYSGLRSSVRRRSHLPTVTNADDTAGRVL